MQKACELLASDGTAPATAHSSSAAQEHLVMIKKQEDNYYRALRVLELG